MQALDLFLDLDLPIVGAEPESTGSLNRDAFGAAQRFGCSYYDAIFIALAERLGTRLITADSKVYERLSSLTDVLVWLSEVTVQ